MKAAKKLTKKELSLKKVANNYRFQLKAGIVLGMVTVAVTNYYMKRYR